MQPKLKCLIIDDEPKSIELLNKRLSILFPEIDIIGSYTDWQKGLEVLRKTKIDILFLDVSMPEKSGIDFLKLFSKIDFQVIFVTAHAEFAIDAIKFSAVGYVLKPVEDYELSFAVHKAIERISANGTENAKDNGDINATKIGVPNVKGIDYINLSEILYFESVKKYTKVVTSDYSIVSSYNIGEFKKIIDGVFLQVHRSFIVNVNYIKRYEINGTIVMEDDMQIPVSKSYKTEVLEAFNKMSRTAGYKNKKSS